MKISRSWARIGVVLSLAMASIQWSSAVICQQAWFPYLVCRVATGSEQTSFESVGTRGLFSCPQNHWADYVIELLSGSTSCVPNRPVFVRSLGSGAAVFELLSSEVSGTFTMRLRGGSNRARSTDRVVSLGGSIPSDPMGDDTPYVRASQRDFGYPGIGLTIGDVRYSVSCALRYNLAPISCI